MKKTLLFIFAVSFFFSCSVEPMDPYLEEGLDQELKMTTEDNDCTIVHNFGDAGTITVTNDGEHLLVTIAASGDFSLTGARLQVSNSYNDFPTVGRGNLPPGKMNIHKKFKDGVQEYTWEFPLNDYNGSVVIASFSEFTNAEGSFSAWAGDEEVKFGNWAYFEYEIVECAPACETPDLGEDVVLNYPYAEASDLIVDDLLEDFGYGDEGFPMNGTFEPELETLVEQIQNNSGGEPLSLSSTYTVGEGDCEASVNLAIEVDACEPVNAGEDQSGRLKYSIADHELDGLDDLRDVYLELLDEEISRNGTFEPSMQEISDDFQDLKSEAIGVAFPTTYTIGSGDCVDSVELTITIVQDVDPCENVDAGADNEVTLTYSEADALPDDEAVTAFFLDMLEPGVSREGTFSPEMQVTIDEFQEQDEEVSAEYVVTYTLTEGQCEDSVQLILNVVPDSEDES